MSQAFANRYTGAWAFAQPAGRHAPGTCRGCGQPSANCCCGCRECRTESKELLVEASDDRQAGGVQAGFAAMMNKPINAAAGAGVAGAAPDGIAKAFIGGGCCVHVSVEYAPVAPAAAVGVLIVVHDSEGTSLAWVRQDPAGGHYQVKENVITTKPGATLMALAQNATVRVRWCETFSC